MCCLKKWGLKSTACKKECSVGSVLGASQQGFSYALGHQERVDNFIGINFPLAGSLAHSEAFLISIVHLMSISNCNSKFYIHKESLFLIGFIEQVGVSFVQVLHSALDIRQPSGMEPKKKKFLLCFHSKFIWIYSIA